MIPDIGATLCAFTILSAILQLVKGAPIQKRQSHETPEDESENVFSPIIFDFEIVKKSSISGSTNIQNKNIRKVNQSQLIVELENEVSMYTMEIEVGTPKQQLSVILDTGSSDLWVPSVDILKTQPLIISEKPHGTFNASNSTTFKQYQDQFSISYGDASTASGIWANDTLSVKGLEIQDIIFGYATSSSTSTGIFGIGMRANEASSWVLQAIQNNDTQLSIKELNSKGVNNGFYYDNFPYLLKKEGYIKNCGYSLFLSSASNSKGSIIFGAIDTEKYHGALQTLSLIDVDDSSTETADDTKSSNSTSSDSAKSFFVGLDSLATKYKNGTTQNFTQQQANYPALLDSGASLIYAPFEVADQLQTLYGTYSKAYNHYVTSCKSEGPDLQFQFSNKTISIPFENLLFKVDSTSEECVLGIANSETDYFILGDAFLRSSYVYYNLENKTVSIAQANYQNSTKLQVVT